MPSSHGAIFRERLGTSRRVAAGVTVLGLLALLAVFADLVAGDAPLVFRGPYGLEVLPGVVHPSAVASRTSAELSETYGSRSAVWPLVHHGPERESDDVMAGPSGDHPLGTDERGRDLLARLVFGARTALGLSLLAIALSLALGVILGGAAGFIGAAWNRRLDRLVETVDTFPAIIVVALIRAIEGAPSALSLVIAVAVVRWAEVARLVRGEVIRSGSEDYVLAAKALGCSRTRVLVRHLLPNVVGPAITSSVFGVASVVLLEAAVSFLEMGRPTRAASWGETLAEAARHPGDLRLLLGPAVLLALTLGTSYLFGDALRDAVDARTVRLGRGGAEPDVLVDRAENHGL